MSRALLVHTALRNCTRDEERPFGFGNQVLIPSHRKLLRSKAVVVSIAETLGRRSWQARLGRGERKRTAAEASKAALMLRPVLAVQPPIFVQREYDRN